MNDLPDTDERAAFEEWYCRSYHPASLTREGGCYIQRGAGMAWDAWCGRAANAPRPADHNDEPVYSTNMVADIIEAKVAAERERLLSELRTLHAQQNGRHNYYLYAAELLAGKL